MEAIKKSTQALTLDPKRFFLVEKINDRRKEVDFEEPLESLKASKEEFDVQIMHSPLEQDAEGHYFQRIVGLHFVSRKDPEESKIFLHYTEEEQSSEEEGRHEMLQKHLKRNLKEGVYTR